MNNFFTVARNTIIARGATEAEADRVMKNVNKCVAAAQQSSNVHKGKVANSIVYRIKETESIEQMEQALDNLYYSILGWDDSAE